MSREQLRPVDLDGRPMPWQRSQRTEVDPQDIEFAERPPEQQAAIEETVGKLDLTDRVLDVAKLVRVFTFEEMMELAAGIGCTPEQVVNWARQKMGEEPLPVKVTGRRV